MDFQSSLAKPESAKVNWAVADTPNLFLDCYGEVWEAGGQ